MTKGNIIKIAGMTEAEMARKSWVKSVELVRTGICSECHYVERCGRPCPAAISFLRINMSAMMRSLAMWN